MTEQPSNNFNFLRLLFASLVILSHAPELIDGNRSREILTCLFHSSLSFGQLSVDGFFVISGFLISQSWLSDPNAPRFLLKRCARIYPAFILALLASLFCFAPLGAPDLHQYYGSLSAFRILKDSIGLDLPRFPLSFIGQPLPTVNGALWTIPYEIRCYAMLCLVGVVTGISLRTASLCFGLSLVGVICTANETIKTTATWGSGWSCVLLDPADFSRSALFFWSGAVIQFLQPRFSPAPVLQCAGLLLMWLSLKNTILMNVTLATVGGFLLIKAGLTKPNRIQKWMGKLDPSYGVYLYAWPLQKLLYWYVPTIDPFVSAAVVWLLSLLIGVCSWRFIERPCIEKCRLWLKRGSKPGSLGVH